MVLRKAVYTFDQCPIYGIVICIAKIHRFRDQRAVPTTHHISSDPLETFWFIFLHIYALLA